MGGWVVLLVVSFIQLTEAVLSDGFIELIYDQSSPSVSFGSVYTPEKVLDSTAQTLDLNTGDLFRLGAKFDQGLVGEPVTYKWYFNSRLKTTSGWDDSTSPLISSSSFSEGQYELIVSTSTENLSLGLLTVSATDFPLSPEDAVPSNPTFVDSDTTSYISGQLSWERSAAVNLSDPYRLFDFYIVHLGDATNRIDLVTSVPRDETSIIISQLKTTHTHLHISTFETDGSGSLSSSFASVAISPFAGALNLPMPSQLTFSDTNFVTDEIQGTLEISFDPEADLTEIASVEVWFASGASPTSLILQTKETDLISTGAMTYNVSICSIPCNIASFPFLAVFTVGASSARSSMRFLRLLDVKEIDVFPDRIVSSLLKSKSVPLLENMDGCVRVEWPVLSFDSIAIENNIQDPVTEYSFDISLGGMMGCRYSDFANGWAADAPTKNWEEIKLSPSSTEFSLTACFEELLACGFTPDGTTDELSISGEIELYIFDSSFSLTEQLLTFKAHAAVAWDSVARNVLLVDTKLTHIVQGGDIGQAIKHVATFQLYDSGFVSISTNNNYTAEVDTVHGELRLEIDYLNLDVSRIYFTQSEDRFGKVLRELSEHQFPDAFRNFDTPRIPGRVRFTSILPLILDCAPCFLHVEGRLSGPSKKSIPQTRDVGIVGSAQLSIGAPIELSGACDFNLFWLVQLTLASFVLGGLR